MSESVLVHNVCLGDDWVARKLPDEITTFDCGECAEDILERLGTGKIVTVTPRVLAPGLGGYRDASTLWSEHTVVVADGRVFDVYGPADGVPIDDWKALRDYPQGHQLWRALMDPTRENWIFFKEHVGMFVPRHYAWVAGFVAGACWASPTFLDRFQAFVSVEPADGSPLTWYGSIGGDAVCGRWFGVRLTQRRDAVVVPTAGAAHKEKVTHPAASIVNDGLDEAAGQSCGPVPVQRSDVDGSAVGATTRRVELDSTPNFLPQVGHGRGVSLVVVLTHLKGLSSGGPLPPTHSGVLPTARLSR